jgi:Uma2 family endonuclease
MATAPPLLSIEEYLRTSYHPDADYVDGEIEERNLGEYEHARLQYILATIFGRYEREWNVRGLTEQRIYINSSRVRICDLCLISRDAVRERVLRQPPLLCIEILSPEDRLSRAEIVLQDYLNIGVQNIWLLDPIRQAAHIFNSTGLHIVNTTNLTVPNTPIHLDLTEAFAAID